MRKRIRFGWAAALLLLAACGQALGTPGAAGTAPPPLGAGSPAAATASAEPQTPTDTPVPALSAGPLAEVPRNRMLVLGAVIQTPLDVTNSWNTVGYTHQEGNNLLWEGLAYYAIFADQEIPWLAESMTYSKPDFTELTIKLNPAARWSDGQPVSAQDVLFTLEGQLNNDQLNYHTVVQEYMQAVQAPDEQTVVVTFKIPAPRFKFEVLTLKFDTGLPIVPAHTLSQQANVNAFAGGLDMPHSGPYRLVYASSERKVFDLRPDWWAVQAGLMALPAVQRVVISNTLLVGYEGVAPAIVHNDLDTAFDMLSPVISGVLKQNPKVTTYTGSAPPFGYLDWWSNSLWLNTQLPAYQDPRVRRALSLAIDRDRLNQLLYGGAPIATIYPFPLYPALQRFVDSPEVKALEAKYQPGKFDLAESARLMSEAGFTKNSDGLWARDGQTLDASINAFEGLSADLAPVLAEMLKAGGFKAVVNFSNNVFQNMVDGQPGLYLFGHAGSLIDPFATFDLYHSRYIPPVGTSTDAGHMSRYNNPEYDQIVDAMAVLPADDPKFQALAVQAMEIYWRDVIDIPVVQWVHRIRYNTTYWTNWPAQDNLAMGTNGAFWAHTGMLVVTSLKPAQ